MYILDTDICIYAMNASVPSVLDRLARVAAEDVNTTTVNAAELYFGAYRSGRPEPNLERVKTFLAPFNLLVFDGSSAELHASLRRDLTQAGTPIGAHDMLIAAIALSAQATVVTHNVEEFSRVPGLRYEDWTIPL